MAYMTLTEGAGSTKQYFYNKKNQLIQLERKLETLHYTYDLQGNLLDEGMEKQQNVTATMC